MGRITIRKLALLALALAFVLVLPAGCSKQAPTESPGGGSGYAGALDTSYENALDVTGQLALGTMKLEGTPDAVTAEQAAKLLPLWQALAGSALQGDAEHKAALRQVEGTMTGEQIAAITAMRLTGEDVGAWTQSQGGGPLAGGDQRPGGGMRPGGGAQGLTEEQIAQMREQFQNASPEELATRRAQFSAGGQGQSGSGGRAGSPAGGGSSAVLTRGVIALLAERSGTALAPAARRTRVPTETPLPAGASVRATPTAPQPEPTSTVVGTGTPQSAEPPETPTPIPSPTPEPVVYVVQPGDSLAAIGRAYGVTVAAIVEANSLQDPDRIRTGQELVLPDPARLPAAVIGSGSGASPGAGAGMAAPAAPAPALRWVQDTDPGPPFTVEVSANRATQDPLVAKSKTYKVTGIVRNHGERTYAVSALHVTFYDAEGFRGYINKYPMVPGAEWIWHGRTEADFPCLLLAPGEECPFSIEITAQDMASFLIHPDATRTERASAPVELSGVRVSRDGTAYVRITGTATNPNPFVVKDVTVVGTLIDGGGQIVSVGSTYVLGESIQPGASVPFDVRVRAEPYARYQLYAQAQGDGE